MANNPYYNKVIHEGDVLIDLTADTVTADKLASGYTAHDHTGALITGTMSGGSYATGSFTPAGVTASVTMTHNLGTTNVKLVVCDQQSTASSTFLGALVLDEADTTICQLGAASFTFSTARQLNSVTLTATPKSWGQGGIGAVSYYWIATIA